MGNLISENQVLNVNDYHDLLHTSHKEGKNAICYNRNLKGDFSEIVNKLKTDQNITVLSIEDLLEIKLSENGQIAREEILNDFKVLLEYGAAPSVNIIRYYERDDMYPFFATDVYSFHVDRSPFPIDTFLCTYYGAPSEVLPNADAEQKIYIQEIRDELKNIYKGDEIDFDDFLIDNFFDLHYQAKPNANIINLGLGNLWRLATDYPESNVLPCIHRAPIEKDGQLRLLLIC